MSQPRIHPRPVSTLGWPSQALRNPGVTTRFRGKTAAVCAALGAALSVSGASGAGLEVPPIETWNGPTPAASQSRPEYGQEVTDPVFGTRFMRVTDNGDRGYYSLRPVFNRDSTMFVLNSGDVRRTEDRSLVGNLYGLSGKKPFRNPTWSKVDPDIIYGTIELKFVSLNLASGEVRVIRDMGALDGFVSFDGHIYMDNLQSIAGDDEYIVLSDVTRGGTRVVVVDIRTGGRESWIRDAYSRPDFNVRVDPGPDYRMNVGISPSGDYIVLHGRDGEYLFDRQFNPVRKLVKHGHGDFGFDTDGNEVYVSICPAIMERLNDGKVTDLLGPDSYACGHINASANYGQPGWAYLSINRDKNDVGANGYAQGFEIVAVRLDPKDGTSVRRIVHPHNTGDSNEKSAFAVPNTEGTRVLFNSTWDDLGPVNSYIANLTRVGPEADQVTTPTGVTIYQQIKSINRKYGYQ